MENESPAGPRPADEGPQVQKPFAETERAAGLLQARVQISAGEIFALRQFHGHAQQIIAQGLQTVFGHYERALPGPVKYVEKVAGSENEYILHHEADRAEKPKIQLATAMPREPKGKRRKGR